MEKINYGRKDYESDCKNPEMPHIKDREHFKNFYDELGRDPVQYEQNWPNSHAKRFDIVPEGEILELGCHYGYNVIHWAQEGFTCTGVELSDTILDRAREALSKEPTEVQERVTFIQSFIEDFVPPKKYKTIILTETLEHVIDPVLVVKKARECITDDGTLHVSAPTRRIGTFSHVRGVTPEYATKILNEAGFSKVNVVEKFLPDQLYLTAQI